MLQKVEKNDYQIKELEDRLKRLEQKLYLSTDSDEIITIQIEKNQLIDEWKTLMHQKNIQ